MGRGSSGMNKEGRGEGRGMGIYPWASVCRTQWQSVWWETFCSPFSRRKLGALQSHAASLNGVLVHLSRSGNMSVAGLQRAVTQLRHPVVLVWWDPMVSVEWCWLLTIGADGEGISMKLMAGWWRLGPEAIITIVSSGNKKMQREKIKKIAFLYIREFKVELPVAMDTIFSLQSLVIWDQGLDHAESVKSVETCHPASAGEEWNHGSMVGKENPFPSPSRPHPLCSRRLSEVQEQYLCKEVGMDVGIPPELTGQDA